MSGCLSQNMPAPISAEQTGQLVTETIAAVSSAATPVGQSTKLFDFTGKTRESVIQDFEQNSEKYHDYNAPKPGSTGDAGLTDRDYLLEGLACGMNGAWVFLNTNDTRILDFDKISKIAILQYYYCKYLYDMVVNGKMSIEQAKIEFDSLRMLKNDNSLENINSVCAQVDGGRTLADIRKANPGWFKDPNAPPATKGPPG
jgi:hypothetical protein